MRLHAVLLESSLSSKHLCCRNMNFILHATAVCSLIKRKKKVLRKPQFYALVSLRRFKLTVCIKPGSTSAKQLWRVLGESLFHSFVKAGSVQPRRHEARKTPHESSSRPSSWEDV